MVNNLHKRFMLTFRRERAAVSRSQPGTTKINRMSQTLRKHGRTRRISGVFPSRFGRFFHGISSGPMGRTRCDATRADCPTVTSTGHVYLPGAKMCNPLPDRGPVRRPASLPDLFLLLSRAPSSPHPFHCDNLSRLQKLLSKRSSFRVS